MVDLNRSNEYHNFPNYFLNTKNQNAKRKHYLYTNFLYFHILSVSIEKNPAPGDGNSKNKDSFLCFDPDLCKYILMHL